MRLWKERKAVSRTLVILAVMIIIVVGVAAAALYRSPTSSSQSTSTTASKASSSESLTSIASVTTSSKQSSTPASASTAATTSTSSSTTESTTCISTSPTNASAGQELVAQLGAYSSMSFGFVGTKNGSAHDLNLTYTVVYHTSTTYKVSLNYALNRASKTATMWILDNGTVLALYAKGENYTGSTANNIVLNYFSDLETLNIFALQASTDALYFHSTGNTITQIGTNSFPVTEYGTNTSPEKIQGCGAESGVLNTYNVYLGTPTGSSLKLVTYASFSGSLTTASGTTTENYTYQLTALTVS